VLHVAQLGVELLRQSFHPDKGHNVTK
jgi:hypothetical protein